MNYTGFHRALEIDHRAHRDSWQIHICSEIEADQLDAWRIRSKEKNGKAPSYTAMVIKAIAMAIDELRPTYPQINSFLSNYFGWKRIQVFDGISAGCSTAIDTEEIVLVGVVLEPHKKSLHEITRELAGFSNRDTELYRNTRSFYKLPKFIQTFLHWLSKNLMNVRYNHRGTFCLNPIGKFGVDMHLSLPQTSCLQFGMGNVKDRVIAREGKPVVVKTFFLSASFDRRLMNGRPAAILMDRVRLILNQADFKE